SMRNRNVTQGALVAIDPTTGAIVTMVGSANPGDYGGQYNLAVWPPRNPGSSMKIFTYTAAIASGKYTMTTPIVDSRFTYRDPLNSYGPSLTLGGYGETPLQMATGASVLATQGLLRQPYAINLITRGGELVYMHPVDPGTRVLDARVAFIMQSIMSNDNNRAM